MRSSVLTVAAVLLGLILSFLFGRVSGILSIPVAPVTLREDTRPIIPVVQMDATDGALTGKASGDVRLFFDGRMIITGSGGAFRVLLGAGAARPASIPAGMRYVASRRGSKYYPVSSLAGQRIVAANRIYFSSSADAEAAGYAAGR